jgi:hypothetical protein
MVIEFFFNLPNSSSRTGVYSASNRNEYQKQKKNVDCLDKVGSSTFRNHTGLHCLFTWRDRTGCYGLVWCGLACSSTVKMEGIFSCDSSVALQRSTSHYIAEDRTPYIIL